MLSSNLLRREYAALRSPSQLTGCSMVAVRPESSSKQYPMPFTRIEIAVMSLVDGELHVLLARRAESPHAGKWSLPGGVLRIDLDRSLEMGARRVMNERLGLELRMIRQLCAVGGPERA